MESGLSIGYPDLAGEVGFFLSYGRSSGGWSTDQLAEIDRIIQSGYRRVLYPPAVVKEAAGYEWSWLRPSTTVDIVDGIGDYDLPDDFGRLIGDFHYEANEHRSSVKRVSVGQLLELRSSSDQAGAPRYVAIRYKAGTGVTGQRQEALFYPTPDSDHTLAYCYDAYTGKLTNELPYPLGGMVMSELYIESCLAMAEGGPDDALGNHFQQYTMLLVDRIARDRKQGPRFFGNMGNREIYDIAPFRRGHTGTTYSIIYHGGEI